MKNNQKGSSEAAVGVFLVIIAAILSIGIINFVDKIVVTKKEIKEEYKIINTLIGDLEAFSVKNGYGEYQLVSPNSAETKIVIFDKELREYHEYINSRITNEKD